MQPTNDPIIIFTGDGIADAGQEDKLSRLRQRLDGSDRKLLLHLHGGLVNKANGEAAARRLAGTGDGSWGLSEDWVQVYVVWRTGVAETIRKNWTDLAEDHLYQVVLRKLLRFVARQIGIPTDNGARSVEDRFSLDELEIQDRITGARDTKDPFADVDVHFSRQDSGTSRATLTGRASDIELADEFERQLLLDADFKTAVAEIDAALNESLLSRNSFTAVDPVRGRKSLDHLSATIRAQWPDPDRKSDEARGLVAVGVFLLKYAGEIAYRCFKRFRSERHHGFHATVVEEICRVLYADRVGAAIWGLMVQDAADHFKPAGFGSSLLDVLAAAPEPRRFVVSAHSAGSIWASHMLLAMASRDLQIKLRLFLLAPAVRQSLFAQVISGAANQIELCRMYTMSDEYEKKDAVLGHDKGYIYPSSLLYCVSGIFETLGQNAYPDAPLVGMRRFTAAPWLNAEEAAAETVLSRFFQQPQNGIVEAPQPQVTEANSHGAFDDEKLTLKSVASLF